MVARVLFPVLIRGGTRSHPQHRATIKALPSPHHPPSPLRIPSLDNQACLWYTANVSIFSISDEKPSWWQFYEAPDFNLFQSQMSLSKNLNTPCEYITIWLVLARAMKRRSHAYAKNACYPTTTWIASPWQDRSAAQCHSYYCCPGHQ